MLPTCRLFISNTLLSLSANAPFTHLDSRVKMIVFPSLGANNSAPPRADIDENMLIIARNNVLQTQLLSVLIYELRGNSQYRFTGILIRSLLIVKKKKHAFF
jgi:hypothetical protein